MPSRGVVVSLDHVVPFQRSAVARKLEEPSELVPTAVQAVALAQDTA
jgi:hypothetical protein